MKYTIILIAVVFLIGISVSDGKPKKGAAKNQADDAGKKNQAAKNEKSANDSTKGGKKQPPKGSEDDEDEEDASEDGVEEEEKEKLKKNGTGKKKTLKNPPPKKSKVSEEEEDEEDEENEEEEAARKPTARELKDQAASMNPANVIAALQDTPIDQLNKILPQMNQLTEMLEGTPMGSIFQNLTSLLGSSPLDWQNVYKLFPNFLSTIIGTGAQLANVAATAVGRLGKSGVEIADALFNGGKDILGTVTALPGGHLFTPLGQILDIVHGTVVTPFDSGFTELKAAAKRQQRLAERAVNRSRSAGSGNLLGGNLLGGNLFGGNLLGA